MELLTDEIRKTLPPIGGQDEAIDPIVHVHYFDPSGAANWWITEGGEEGGTFYLFGLCDLGMGFPELGYVSLAELEAVKGPLGLGIERDLYWTPQRLSEVRR